MVRGLIIAFILIVSTSFIGIPQDHVSQSKFSKHKTQNRYKTKKESISTIVYKNWTVAHGGNCGQVNYKCAGFNYGIVRSKYKVYSPSTGSYYYYYYIYFISNSTYNGGRWAHTALYDVDFYMNGKKVHNENYLLFKQKNNVCVMWHPTDANVDITFSWKNIIVY